MLAFVKILKKFDKVNRLPFKPLLTFHFGLHTYLMEKSSSWFSFFFFTGN
jgi:hypothetical protein